jgi:hypothetical protein
MMMVVTVMAAALHLILRLRENFVRVKCLGSVNTTEAAGVASENWARLGGV